MDTFGRYIAKYAPQYNNKKKLKLMRYRKLLIKTLEKYWVTNNKLYRHQHSRICRMAMKDYPDMIFERW